MELIVPLLEVLVIGIPLLQLALRAWIAPKERDRMARVAYGAFAARLVASLIFATFPETRIFHEDAVGYEQIGCDLASAWLGELPPSFAEASNTFGSGRFPGFLFFCGGLFYVFGRYRLVATAFLSLIGGISTILLYRMTARVFHERVAYRAALLTAFFPSMILWSSMAVKDPLMIFLLLAGLNAALSLRDRFNFPSVLVLAGVLWSIWAVRFYIVYFFLLAVVASMVLVKGKNSLSRMSSQIVAAGLIVGLLAAVGMTSNFASGLDKINLEAAQSFRTGMAYSANSGFARDVDISSTSGAISFLPVGLATLLFGPFPWQMSSFRALLTLPEMLLWWSMIPALLRGLRYAIRREFFATAPLLAFTLTLCVAYAISLGNLGAAFRQRAQVFVFLFMFVALGHYVAICKKKRLNLDILSAARNRAPTR